MTSIIFLLFLLFGCPSARAEDSGASLSFNRGTPGPDPSTITARLKPLPSNYPIPKGSLYISPRGNDTNGDGTIDNPYATLKKALNRANAGQTIVMRGGIYRLTGHLPYPEGEGEYQWNVPVTIQNYPNEVPELRGTAVVRGWIADGANWRKDNWTAWDSGFSDCSLSKEIHNTKQTFLDDGDGTWKRLRAVNSVGQLAPGKFFYDPKAKQIFIRDDPTVDGRTVEATIVANVMLMSHWNAGTVVRGLVWKGFGTNCTSDQSGVIRVNSSSTTGITLENNVFAYNAYRGLHLYGLVGTRHYNHVVRGNSFIENGGGGIGCFACNGTLVQSNYFGGNNYMNFSYRGAVGDGGNKFLNVKNLTVRDNLFENENANGVWCDSNCNNFYFLHNIVRNSAQCGFFLEATGTGPFVVAANLFYNNALASGVCFNAGNGRIYNNTVVGNGISNIRFEIGGSTNQLYNNLMSDPITGLLPVEGNLAVLSGDGQVSQSGKNLYHRTKPSSTPTIRWASTTYSTLADFKKAHPAMEVGSIVRDNVAASRIFTLNRKTGAYSLPTGSPAIGAGVQLPRDIATLLGVSTAPVNIGYLP
jgi:hypothetical protein